MNEKNLFDILNNSDDYTIELLSNSFDFTTSSQKNDIFSRSIKKSEKKKTDRVYSEGVTVSGTEIYKRQLLPRITGFAAALLLIFGGAFAIYSHLRRVPELPTESSELNSDYSRSKIVDTCKEQGFNVEAPQMIPAGFTVSEPDVKPFIVQFIFQHDEKFMNFAYMKNPVAPNEYKEFFSVGDSELTESSISVNGHDAKRFEQTVNGKYYVNVVYEIDGIMTTFGFENIGSEEINSILETVK